MNKAPIVVSEVRIRMAETDDDGLIAWASCVINSCLYVNNIAIRKSQEGEIFLTFPAKKSKKGVKYFYLRPINREAKAILDAAILGEFKGLSAT